MKPEESDWAALMHRAAQDMADKPLSPEECALIRLMLDEYSKARWLRKRIFTTIVWLGGLATAASAVWQFITALKK